ncbi:uncharacterized protein N7459_005229 [Penicillium hispanicum]|uniref:uncharacterized protein n=1 Tax=Penicillium hispanicum TaxID=1080232 RepID=UPI0025420186|nr:uncharacterized protein N7459_005229 [Penicillium hispanicum]KAJ5585429.1 hypothetical protein N7459_005229 [Penicillium hispanicum]
MSLFDEAYRAWSNPRSNGEAPRVDSVRSGVVLLLRPAQQVQGQQPRNAMGNAMPPMSLCHSTSDSRRLQLATSAV